MSGWHTRIAGVPVGFGAPAWLWAAAALLVVGAVAAVWAWRSRTSARGWVSPQLADWLVTGRSPPLAAARTLLWAVGMALLATALARPQLGATEERVRRRGLDVVAVVDASRSMMARDAAPDRIGRAKLEIESLLDDLAGDRIGLVTFSSEGFVQMPLTTDYAAARTFLRQIDPRQLPQGGTNIGAGLRTAQQLFSVSADKRAHVVLLFSDGEDWRGDAVDAAAALHKAGTTVYTVGVGTAAGAPVQSASGHTVVSRMDPTGLTAIARAGHGAMWTGDGAVGAIAGKLATAQKSELEERRVVAYRERFQIAAVAGLLALAAAALVTERRRRGKASVVAAAAALALLGGGAHASAAEWTKAPEPTTQAGVQQYRGGRYDEALRAFERAPAKGDARATVAYDRAAALYKLGRYDEARRAFAEAAQAAGGVGVDAELGVGNSLAKLGDKSGAIAAYRRTLERAPQYADARHNLELMLAEEKQKQPPKQNQQQSKQKQQQQSQANQQPQQNKQQQNGQQKEQSAQNQQPQQSGQQKQQSGDNQQRQQQRSASAHALDRGGFGEPISPAARRLLDSVQRDERVLPVWRFSRAAQPRRTDEVDKDW